MILLVVAMVMAGLLYRVKKLGEREKVGERELAATLYWCDMGDLFRELRDDPFMTSAKWRGWLPLFEDADRRFAETHPHVKDFFRYSEAVKREIADVPFEEIGSS